MTWAEEVNTFRNVVCEIAALGCVGGGGELSLSGETLQINSSCFVPTLSSQISDNSPFCAPCSWGGEKAESHMTQAFQSAL